MATIPVNFGPGNTVHRDVTHTDQIRNDAGLYQTLGASSSNTEVVVNGSVYNGPLYDGDSVTLRTKANAKAKRPRK